MKLVPNPCKSICTIKNKICIGCNRSTEEIAAWPTLSNDEKRIIVDRIKNTYNGQGTSQHSS